LSYRRMISICGFSGFFQTCVMFAVTTHSTTALLSTVI